jgi:hypothetical protein
MTISPKLKKALRKRAYKDEVSDATIVRQALAQYLGLNEPATRRG